jgi:hypothetical protein
MNRFRKYPIEYTCGFREIVFVHITAANPVCRTCRSSKMDYTDPNPRLEILGGWICLDCDHTGYDHVDPHDAAYVWQEEECPEFLRTINGNFRVCSKCQSPHMKTVAANFGSIMRCQECGHNQYEFCEAPKGTIYGWQEERIFTEISP